MQPLELELVVAVDLDATGGPASSPSLRAVTAPSVKPALTPVDLVLLQLVGVGEGVIGDVATDVVTTPPSTSLSDSFCIFRLLQIGHK